MRINKNNLILNADSYKYSQFNQYPEGTEYVYSYIESRGGKWDRGVFFGLQSFIREYLTSPVTMKDVEEAAMIMGIHGEPFNYDGWRYIVEEHNGMIPIEISAVDEGTVVPISNVLVTVVNTDPKCYWVTSFFETAILRAVWYGTTVCTNSYMSKQVIKSYLEETGDVSTIDFKLHDFGSRGVSSFESSGLGGAAHLVNFLGTDNVTGIIFANNYYDAEVAGFSIPAMEHSTITSWGRENEVDSYRNMIKKNAKKEGMFACVSDSYDIFEACRMWGTDLKQDVIDSGATLVVRPDSGDPAEVVLKCLEILSENFGYTINDKGFKVLNNVRVIQGDGINCDTIDDILATIVDEGGFSADNVAFGQGGGLLQQLDRDTMKFAMKCSAIRVNGVWRDVYKDPITDKGKRSKRGIFDLIRDKDGKIQTVVGLTPGPGSLLKVRYVDGLIKNELTFEQIRNNSLK